MPVQKSKRQKLLVMLRFVPLAVMACLIAVLAFSGRQLTAQQIFEYSPENPYLAAAFLVLLYALKSLSVVFPLLVLYLAGGLLFSAPVALAVNMLGTAVCLSLPYWVGRWSAGSITGLLAEKYPKVRALLNLQQQNDFFFAFLVRVVGFLPCDVVSLYLGSAALPFGSYLVGGMLGMLPGILTTTLMGASIRDPRSPQFIVSVAISVVLSVTSIALYRRMTRLPPKDAAPPQTKLQ